MKNSKDAHESDRLFAELDGLEWLKRQIARRVSTRTKFGLSVRVGQYEKFAPRCRKPFSYPYVD